MDTEVDFYSEKFNPILPQDSQVNPECYGAELAWWLCRKLAENGVFTSYPNFEDWGWFLEFIVDDYEYWLCCGNIVGERNRWRIFLRPHARGMFGRKRAPLEAAGQLLAAVKEVLEQSREITGIEWHEG